MEKNYQVVFTGKGVVELLEVPMPEVQPKEVLIKTLVSQISTGTELTCLEANVDEGTGWAKDIKYPWYPGYSNVGEIVAVGEEVDSKWVGKKVLTQCQHKKYVTTELERDIWEIPEGVEADEAVFGIIAQITMGSVRAAQIRPGETVVVFGAGLIGQFVARQAKIAGALNVIVADVSESRLNMVPKDTTFSIVNTTENNVQEHIRKINDGKLADVVFETTGYHPLIASEIECVAKNGKILITSSPKGRSLVDFDYCNRMGITIIGAHNYAVHPEQGSTLNPWTRARDTRYYLQLMARKQMFVENMITHRIDYKDAPKGYKMLMEDRTKALGVHIYWED